MNVVAVDATIGDRTLRTLRYNYSSDTGRLNRIQVSHLHYYILTYLPMIFNIKQSSLQVY